MGFKGRFDVEVNTSIQSGITLADREDVRPARFAASTTTMVEGENERRKVPSAQRGTGDGGHWVRDGGRLRTDRIGGEVIERGAESVPAWSSSDGF